MQNLGIHLDSDRMRTAGLVSIGRPELSVAPSKDLVEAPAGRLLLSVASYVVSTKSCLEAGDLLRCESRSYNPKKASDALHPAKYAEGRRADVLFDMETGDIIAPEIGEVIGNLRDAYRSQSSRPRAG